MSGLISRCGVLLLLLLLSGCSAKSEPEPIWLGELAPLTGPSRPQGEAAMASIQAALELAREESWSVAGRSVGVRHADSAANARAEAVRLLAVNRVAGLILGPGLSGADEIAATARTHETGVVILDEVAAAPPGPGVVLLGPDPAQRGKALEVLARTRLKMKRSAVLVDPRNPVCAALASAFTLAWRKNGQVREWQVEASLAKGLQDDVKKYAPEVVLLAVPVARWGEIASHLPSVPVLYGGPDEDEETLANAAQKHVRGELYTAAVYAAAAEPTAFGKEWRQRYEKREGQRPGRSAALACDGVRLLMAGLERLRGAVRPGASAREWRQRLREELPKVTEFDTVTGKATWKDGMVVRPLFLLRMQGGKSHLVRTWTGE